MRFELEAHGFGRNQWLRAGILRIGRIQEDGREPAVGTAAGGLGRQRHGEARQAGQVLVVPGKYFAAALHPLVQQAHLAAADARQYVAQPVVVAHFGMLIMGRIVFGLGGEKASFLGQRRVVGNQGPAAAGGQYLVAIEGKHADGTKTAQRLLVEGGPQGFGRVFENGQPILRRDGHDFRELGRHAVEVDQQQGLGLFAFGKAVHNGFAQALGAQVPGVGLAVDEDGGGAQVQDGVGRGHEGERGAQHLIAGAHAQQNQPQVNGRRARGQRHAVRHAGGLANVRFKARQVRAHGSHPIVLNRLVHIIHLVAAQVGRREEQAVVVLATH